MIILLPNGPHFLSNFLLWKMTRYLYIFSYLSSKPIQQKMYNPVLQYSHATNETMERISAFKSLLRSKLNVLVFPAKNFYNCLFCCAVLLYVLRFSSPKTVPIISPLIFFRPKTQDSKVVCCMSCRKGSQINLVDEVRRRPTYDFQKNFFSYI